MSDERPFDYPGSSQGDVPRRTDSPEGHDPDMFRDGAELRQWLLDHQQATGTSDEEILRILCDFMVSPLEVSYEGLASHIVERLERVPGDMS